MKRILSALILLVSVVACQKDPSRTNDLMASSVSTTPELIQAADGSLYSKSCLQENVAEIQTHGSSAMGVCKMKVNFNAASSTGEIERTRFFYNNSSAYIYYPPTYWNTGNSYSSNFFCGFVFGGNYNFNCYALFGYNSSNYNNYSNFYNPSCNYCLYAPNPNRCKNRCYTYGYFYAY